MTITTPAANERHNESKGDGDGFVRFEHRDVDSAEEQVYEYMDRTLQYRVHIGALSNLQRCVRKFSHVYVRYSFFKSGSAQTERLTIPVEGSGELDFRHERRLAIDVTDAFVKYVTSNSLTLEVRLCCGTSKLHSR